MFFLLFEDHYFVYVCMRLVLCRMFVCVTRLSNPWMIIIMIIIHVCLLRFRNSMLSFCFGSRHLLCFLFRLKQIPAIPRSNFNILYHFDSMPIYDHVLRLGICQFAQPRLLLDMSISQSLRTKICFNVFKSQSKDN